MSESSASVHFREKYAGISRSLISLQRLNIQDANFASLEGKHVFSKPKIERGTSKEYSKVSSRKIQALSPTKCASRANCGFIKRPSPSQHLICELAIVW